MTVMELTFIFILIILFTRIVEYLIFIRRVNNICHTYDWKYIDEHGYPVVDVLKDEDYYLKCKWSAYNFLFMDGPSPLSMIFSFKKLNIESQYNKKSVNKLREYEII